MKEKNIGSLLNKVFFGDYDAQSDMARYGEFGDSRDGVISELPNLRARGSKLVVGVAKGVKAMTYEISQFFVETDRPGL